MMVIVSADDEESAHALLIIDLQDGFVSGPHAVPHSRELVQTISGLLRRARAAGALVLHIQNDGRVGEVDEPGTDGWALHLSTEPSPVEVVLRKDGDDAFEGTGLGDLLESQGVTRVVLAGLLSEMCVSATARAALARGLHVIVPRDAHATFDLGGIPAETVARVAEHALGDEVSLPSSSREIRFEPLSAE
jgi:nicotinamidase-related amidase